MNIYIKLLLIPTLTLIISCETTNYAVQSTVPEAGGDGVIRFEDGSYLSGNFKGNNCYDCNNFSASLNLIYFGDFYKFNNSWGFIEDNNYTTEYYSNGSLYKIEFTHISTGNGMAQPIKVTFNNEVYEVYSHYIHEVPSLISSSRPIGLTYDEALKECKTLGFDDASNELLDCVVELSQ